MISELAINQINEGHIQDLIDNAVPERIDLDYKQTPYGKSDKEKRELLKDVSALANSLGGDLIIVLSEKGGVAAELYPLAWEEIDDEVLRIENLLASSLVPRIPDLRIQGIQVEGGGIIIIRVPQSLVGPHRAEHGNVKRFYGRNANQNYELDVEELRRKFLVGNAFSNEISRFVDSRISSIRKSLLPFNFPANHPTLLFHIFPLSALTSQKYIDLAKAKDGINSFIPPAAYGTSSFNSDGVLHAHYSEENGSRFIDSYVQVFRNATIEVGTIYISPLAWGNNNSSVILALYAESYLVKGIIKQVSVLNSMGFKAPYFIRSSIINCANYEIDVEQNTYGSRNKVHALSQNELQLPEVTIERDCGAEEIPNILKAAVDVLFNAGGLLKSPSYKEDGRWENERKYLGSY